MRTARAIALLLSLGSAASLLGQSSDSREDGVTLWLSVREAMRTEVQRLASYSCIQTISRFEKAQSERREALQDTVRMQVTASGGEESFSWPGSANAVSDPSVLLRAGMVGTGLFQGYAYSLFFSPGPGSVEFVGREADAGGSLLHFRFVFDSMRHRLDLTTENGRSSVATRGEFWADESDRLVRRIRLVNVDSAPEINVQDVEYVLDWAPVQMRGEFRLLPQSASIVMTRFTGDTRRNEIALSQCREFQAESAVRFDDAPASTGSAAPRPVTAAGFLPEDLSIPLRLRRAIATEGAAVGDVFFAEVVQDVKRNGVAILRKGDVAEGRIRRVDRHSEPEQHTVLLLEVTTVTTEQKDYLFLGEVVRKGALPGLIERAEGVRRDSVHALGEFGGIRRQERESVWYAPVPGVATFVFRGSHPVLPQGYRMDWKTLRPRVDEP